YIDPVPDNNIILTKTVALSMGKPKKFEYSRNKNVLVLGGSGSGKTWSYVLPNLLQCHSSYVVTDPKGTVLENCGTALTQNGYIIRVLNLNGSRGIAQSQKYNPFAYIQSDADILKFVETLVTNTTGEGSRDDDFFVKAERMYYCALIGYIMSEGTPDERNMRTLLTLLNHSKASEQDEGFESPIDLMFEALEQEKPDSFAVRQYKKYKLAAGKTAKSILVSCGARLSPFDIEAVLEMMDYDELALDKLGDRKTALFVITSDTDKTFNFIAAILYSQMFNLLCDKALYDYGGKLPVHVRCILDEFANIGRIPHFEEIIAVIRSREISASIILQSKAQLASIYDKKADIIIDNCDTLLFLGGKGIQNLEEISKLLGKETIGKSSESQSRGKEKSNGTNTDGMGRELLTPDELAMMEHGMCICQISGVRPFLTPKYNLKKHRRYWMLGEAETKNRFVPDWILNCAPPRSGETFLCDPESKEVPEEKQTEQVTEGCI
ncbi:MAG: type IV secretory system conjugative DNA transfer family protein, partial [Angelakisella sp.]